MIGFEFVTTGTVPDSLTKAANNIMLSAKSIALQKQKHGKWFPIPKPRFEMLLRANRLQAAITDDVKNITRQRGWREGRQTWDHQPDVTSPPTPKSQESPDTRKQARQKGSKQNNRGVHNQAYWIDTNSYELETCQYYVGIRPIIYPRHGYPTSLCYLISLY